MNSKTTQAQTTCKQQKENIQLVSAMRRMLMLAASAAVMLTSCSNDKEIGDLEEKNGGEINFRTLIDKGAESRATVTNSENILGFTVTGWWDKTAGGNDLVIGGTADKGGYLFNAFDLTRREAIEKGTPWDYDPKIYWPSSGSGVHFFAYSPASSKNVNKGINNYQANQQLEYTVPDPGKTEAQEDFLMTKTGVLNKEKTVKLNFAHVLSRATFSARKTNKDMTYLIKSVTLVNIKKSGKIKYEVIPSGGSFAAEYTKALDEDKGVVHWTDHATPNGGNDNLSIDLGETPAFVRYDDEGTFYSILGETNALMVLPQTTKIWDDSQATFTAKGFAVKVEYKAYIDVNDPGTYYAGAPDGDNEWKTVYFPVLDKDLSKEGSPVAHTFEIGRQYNFALTFGSEAGGAIGFDVSVGDWSDAPVVDIPQITNYWEAGLISQRLAAAANPNYGSEGVTLGDIMKVTKLFIGSEGGEFGEPATGNVDATEGTTVFKGIEYFANLKTINLNNAEGLVLDISKLDTLTYVNLGFNVSF